MGADGGQVATDSGGGGRRATADGINTPINRSPVWDRITGSQRPTLLPDPTSRRASAHQTTGTGATRDRGSSLTTGVGGGSTTDTSHPCA
jgi:hypothetical protein